MNVLKVAKIFPKIQKILKNYFKLKFGIIGNLYIFVR